MLVLGRKVGERILIEGGIEIVVLAVDGNRVRLGIEAPKETRITRGELLDDNSQSSVARTRTEMSMTARVSSGARRVSFAQPTVVG